MAILAVDEVWLREPRLLMPGMGPVGNVKVDWNHPVAKYLDHVFLFGLNGIKNSLAKSTAPVTLAATLVTKGFGPHGGGASFPGTSDNRLVPTPDIFATSTCSIFWGDNGPDIGDADGGVITTSSWNSSNGLQIRIQDDGTISIVKQNAAGILVATPRKQNTINNCGVTVAGNNGRHAIFWNGNLSASSTPTVTYVPGVAGSAIGDQGFSGGYVTYNGLLYYLYFSSIAVPDAIAALITADPYQFLIPA